MTTKPLDRVAASVPVDKLARRVTQRGHEPLKPKEHLQGYLCFEACPDLVDWKGENPDLSGARVGNLTVFGYYGQGRWVVRCDCGLFELRRYRSLSKPAPNRTAENCRSCAKVEYMKERARMRATGKYRDEDQKPK